MTAKSVFLSSGWQHAAVVKSNEVYLLGTKVKQNIKAEHQQTLSDPFYHTAPL